MTSKKLLTKITDFYLNSSDFNGIPISQLLIQDKFAEDKLKTALRMLLRKNKVTFVFGDIHPNPFIKSFKGEPIEIQLEKLESPMFTSACVYPSTEHLKTVISTQDYEGKPFTFRLALGQPSLSFHSFDLSILEFYRSDPGYYYDCDDINGMISISDNYYQSIEISDRDKILLQTFGFSYDEKFNRAVAVFLKYLSDLSPEHQQIWNAKILKDENYKLHPDYFKPSILGEFPNGLCIFQAVIKEQEIINDMCRLMKREPLFRNEYTYSSQPKNFGFLIRPTLNEFNSFIHVLDKMLSDNINRKFFENDIDLSWIQLESPMGKLIWSNKTGHETLC
jgi:hypothetical protein